jgi:hypothetical protein
MLDWRYFTKLNHIKDLPLMEQKRKFLQEVEQVEAEARMSHSQMFSNNPYGAAGGEDGNAITAAQQTIEIEMLTQAGEVIITHSGQTLVMQ